MHCQGEFLFECGLPRDFKIKLEYLNSCRNFRKLEIGLGRKAEVIHKIYQGEFLGTSEGAEKNRDSMLCKMAAFSRHPLSNRLRQIPTMYNN